MCRARFCGDGRLRQAELTRWPPLVERSKLRHALSNVGHAGSRDPLTRVTPQAHTARGGKCPDRRAGGHAGAWHSLSTMDLNADEIARSHVRAWELLAGAVPRGWVRRAGGALGVMTGVELGGFNGVWGEAQDVDPAAVARLLDSVREAGRAALHAAATGLAMARGAANMRDATVL